MEGNAQSQKRKKRVWVQLMDESTRRPFKRMKTELVALPDDDDDDIIVVVAEATHALYDEKQPQGRNYLSHVPPSQLSVYENLDVYLKNNDPLDGNSPIGEHGKSKDKPLVVEVPQRYRSVALCQDVKFSSGDSGGVPTAFKSMRSGTVKSFFDVLFPQTGTYPHCFTSGRRHRPGSRVFFTSSITTSFKRGCKRVLRLFGGKSFTRRKVLLLLFRRTYECDFDEFCAEKTREKVVLIDEAHFTYSDRQLWASLERYNLEKQPGLRLVVFSSYGGIDKCSHDETPSAISRDHMVGLDAAGSRPRLRLLAPELDEMLSTSIAGPVRDIIMELSSGHIGIAHTMVMYLRAALADLMTQTLRSVDLIEVIRRTSQATPTVEEVNAMVKAEHLSVKNVAKILGDVASRKDVLSSAAGRPQSFRKAANSLIRYGFLHVDPHQHLRFASSMHLSIWLHSNQTDPLPHLLSDATLIEFVKACVRRMRASFLQHVPPENTTCIARERQIHMELFWVLVSCLPRSTSSTPEWRTKNKRGFVDLVIRNTKINWLWELLVNGDRAIAHSRRFAIGGKYRASLTGGAKHILLDFRQHRGVRKEKPNFLYIQFLNSYTQARVFGKNRQPGALLREGIQVDE